VAGNGKEESLASSLEGPGARRPSSWSRDGKFLLYEAGRFPSIDIWAVPLVGDRKPFPFLNTTAFEARGRFSPDGKWVAYVSNESGQLETYVATFPQLVWKGRVSTAGGDWPRWRSDGKEIFYLTPENTLVAVEVNSSASRLEFGAARPLFETRAGRNVANPYDVSADGQRFLVNTLAESDSPTLTLIVNWPGLLPQ
jgi:Tol biopolymer transport system component